VPRYEPAAQWTVAPTLRDVFVEIPAPRDGQLARRYLEAFEDWRYDPWELRQIDSYTVFFDTGWNNWRGAFDRWLADPRRSRPFRALRDEVDRERFKRLFRVEFLRQVARRFDREISPAYDHGFDDGWHYGASIQYEWNFRLGYTEGFDRAASRAAGVAFAAAWATAFDREYRLSFDEWSRSVRPEILAIGITDANADGVFQPGETILVDYELANYGGAAGPVELDLHGPHLDSRLTTRVPLPRRAVLHSSEPLRAGIREGTPVRTRTNVALELGGQVRRLTFLVSHPLEFAGGAETLRIDALSGNAVIEVRVANRSRKPVPVALAMERLDDRAPTAFRDLGRLAAGGVTCSVFELAGIRPLDLIGGRLAVRFEAESRGARHDALEFRFPALATDLRDDVLLRYMVALSRDPQADPHDISEARALMLSRVRADWKAAVRGRGNPYKEDYRRGRAETALGALVAAYLAEPRRMTRPDVFDGLGGEIEVLARDLPGIHPFLRKYVKKLARRMERS
jgi:hypothetical protein